MSDQTSPNAPAAPAADAASPQPSAGVAEAPRTITLDDVKAAVEAAFVAREQQLVAGVITGFGKVEAEAITFWAWFSDKLRASPLLVFFLIAFGVVFSINPAKAGLVLWGVARVGLFGWLGYWVDRIIFGRLKGLAGIQLGTAWKRRSLIVSACLIAGALIP